MATVWSDDEWLKKFSGKTLEENKEEGGAETPKTEAQEVGKATRATCTPVIPQDGSAELQAEQSSATSSFSCPGRASCQEMPGEPPGLHGDQDREQAGGAAAHPAALRRGAHDCG